MQRKMNGPAACGKASGAAIERDNAHDAAAQQDAQGANYQPERVKASSAKEWRTAGRIAIATARRATIAGKSDLTYLDFIVLVALSEWLDRDALCFRSLQDLADDCGCSVAAVKGAIKRLIAAGLLEVPVGIRKIARKPGGKVSDRGRPANTYRALIPPNFSNRGSQKEGRFSATCAAENDGGLDSNFGNHGSIPFGNHGCHHVKNRTEGGSALGRAPANSRVGVVLVEDEEDHHEDTAQRALGPVEPAPGAAADQSSSVSDPIIASEEYRDEVPDAMFALDPEAGEDRADDLATLADLDRLVADEMEAERAMLAADAEAEAEWNTAADGAADDLEMIWGGAEIDFRQHVEDAALGLSGEDEDCADRFMVDLVRLLDWAHPTRRAEAIADHMAVVAAFIAAIAGGRRHADEVVGRFMKKFHNETAGVSHG